MKFKNVTDKVKMLKRDGDWVNVQPGKVVDLPEESAKAEGGLEALVPEVKEKAEDKSKEEAPKEVKKKPKKAVKKKPKTREELEKMTKDQLNDYGAVIGLKKISQRMKKSKLVNSILRFLRK